MALVQKISDRKLHFRCLLSADSTVAGKLTNLMMSRLFTTEEMTACVLTTNYTLPMIRTQLLIVLPALADLAASKLQDFL